jgi:hypothetical protein
MFLLSYYLSRCQIQITLLELKVNNFFRGLIGVLSGGHYNECNLKSKRIR